MTNDQLQLIKRHAESTYPEECCGFLIGVDAGDKNRVRTIHRVMSASNANQGSRRNRYNIDPREHIRAEEEARGSNLELVGFYHSHPDASARPSKFDLDHAWAWYTYMVLSVQNRIPKDISAWVLSEDRSGFSQDDLKITGE
jgi:proteasome lid subunit RPN8/RPN11